MTSFLVGMFGAALAGPISVVLAKFWQANHDEAAPDLGPGTGPIPIVVRSAAYPDDPDPVAVRTQPLPAYADLLSSGHHPRSHRAR